MVLESEYVIPAPNFQSLAWGFLEAFVQQYAKPHVIDPAVCEPDLVLYVANL